MTDVLSNQVAVAATAPATQLVAPASSGQRVYIRNRDAAISVYLGASAVTSATGAELKAGELLGNGWIDLPPESGLYARAASGTPRVDVLQVVSD